MCFTSKGCTYVKFTKTGSYTAPKIEYSKDKKNWVNYSFGTNVSMSVGDKCYWRGNNLYFSQGRDSSYIRFSCDGDVEANGNIMSLLDKNCSKNDVPNYCFDGLFTDCTGLLTAPLLPATTLGEWCYDGMFVGCEKLAKCPDLPSTIITFRCYNNMFYNAGIVQGPSILPATTLAKYCYSNMFFGCKKMTNVPVLPAINPVEGCYNCMFQGCESITESPYLSFTNIVNIN